jgi:hypothetical protein
MTYRKRIAAKLRRLADRLDAPVSDTEPMAFIETMVMVEEIQRRNDVVLVLFGREKTLPAGTCLKSQSMLKACHYHIPALSASLRELGHHLGVDLMGDRNA